jgi:uncharacterized spore protein YtfJ
MTRQAADTLDRVREDIEGSSTGSFVEQLAERIGARASVRAVFGEPVERGDLTVIPVARVRWAFGGGAGSGPTEQGSGSGAGGGAMAQPIGYVVIAPDGVSFQRIATASQLSPALMLTAGLGVALVLRALARLVRR